MSDKDILDMYDIRYISPSMIATPMKLKGLWKDAPEKGENPGDIYVTDDNTYLWTGTNWEQIGSVANLTTQPEEVKGTIPTNCCNCGAPLGGDLFCRYCKTKNVRKFAL